MTFSFENFPLNAKFCPLIGRSKLITETGITLPLIGLQACFTPQQIDSLNLTSDCFSVNSSPVNTSEDAKFKVEYFGNFEELNSQEISSLINELKRIQDSQNFVDISIQIMHENFFRFPPQFSTNDKKFKMLRSIHENKLP